MRFPRQPYWSKLPGERLSNRAIAVTWLQLMAKDYIGKFDVKEATGINVDAKTTHNWALSAGLRLGL